MCSTVFPTGCSEGKSRLFLILCSDHRRRDLRAHSTPPRCYPSRPSLSVGEKGERQAPSDKKAVLAFLLIDEQASFLK